MGWGGPISHIPNTQERDAQPLANLSCSSFSSSSFLFYPQSFPPESQRGMGRNVCTQNFYFFSFRERKGCLQTSPADIFWVGWGKRRMRSLPMQAPLSPASAPLSRGGGGGNRQTEKVVAVFSAPNVSSFLPPPPLFSSAEKRGRERRKEKRRQYIVSYLSCSPLPLSAFATTTSRRKSPFFFSSSFWLWHQKGSPSSLSFPPGGTYFFLSLSAPLHLSDIKYSFPKSSPFCQENTSAKCLFLYPA